MREVPVDPPDGESRRLWSSVGDLVDMLPADWILIGGLMVQLHAYELGVADVRVTADIDVLAQARPQGALAKIDAALERNGFTAHPPDFDGYAYRYERQGLVVDVVAPDGIKPPPVLGSGRRAVAVPGGSQALARQEEVTVRLGTRVFALHRPTLLGAVLIKARSLTVHHDRDSQRDDLLLLLSLIEDPRAMADELSPSERRWLRRARGLLAFDRPAGIARERVRRAAFALRLLIRDQ